MLLIPFLAADAPIPLFHGLCAARLVLLREEGLLVGRDLREIVRALLDHRSNADEAVADLVLTLGQRSRALNRLAEVDAVALVGGGCCGAVGRKQHLLAGVLSVILGFGQCAGDRADTGIITYYCHVVRAMAQNDSRLRRSMDLSPCSHSSVRKNRFLRPEGESPSKLDERG